MIKRLDTTNEQSKINFYNFLKSLDPAVYVVKVEKDRPLRTISQNSYYWYILNLASIETGEDSESLHEFFKKKFNMKIEFLDTGKRKVVAASTSGLNTYEFALYLDKAIHFLQTELNINVPTPEQLRLEEYERVKKSYNKMF